jgi:hypothetical protein
MKLSIIATILFALITTMAFSQQISQENTALLPIEKQENERRHFISSSLFVSLNYIVDDPADFYQLG